MSHEAAMEQDTEFTDDFSALDLEEDGVGLETCPPSLKDTPWVGWTDEQKKIMWEHVEYHMDKTAEFNKCWGCGPIPKSQFRPPKTDVSFVYTEKASGKTS